MSQDHTYKIYYSSRDASGKMWCPDCRQVEATLESIFNEAHKEGPQAEIIYVGHRTEWKAPADNKYRHSPWNLTSVPTVLKFDLQGRVVSRIQDDDILDGVKMEEFLKKSSV